MDPGISSSFVVAGGQGRHDDRNIPVVFIRGISHNIMKSWEPPRRDDGIYLLLVFRQGYFPHFHENVELDLPSVSTYSVDPRRSSSSFVVA